jgi:hypothetical protein
MQTPRFGLAGQHGADLDLLDARALDSDRELFGDLLVDFDDHIAFEVLDLLERHAADNAVAQRLDDLARLDNRTDVDALDRTALPAYWLKSTR